MTDPSMQSLTLDVRDIKRQMEEIRERRAGQQQLHDDVRRLTDSVADLATMAKRSHEALFAENDRGEFQQVGIVRQWVTGRRVFLVLITVVPGLVSSAFYLAFWLARQGFLK
jgi:hypothetical protein